MFAGKVILITGATGSIGGEIAARVAEDGGTAMIHGRTSQSVDAAIARLTHRVPDGRFLPAPANFLEPGEIVRMIAQIDSDAGRLDGVVNCAVSAPAGISGAFQGTNPDVYGELCFHAIATLQQLCHAAFPVMERSGGGSMIAVASDAGLFAAPNQSMIGPTRAAIMNFCRNVSLETSRIAIRVNCISCSFVEDTAIFDKVVAMGSRRPETARKRAGLGLPRPGDIAALALFLLGPGSARLTGQVISVNGGLNS